MARSSIRPGPAVLAAALIALAAKIFILDAAVVDGRSMLPLLKPGGVVLVLRCAYGLRWPFGGGYLLRWGTPRPGDVIAAVNPMDGKTVVKRAAAVGPVQLRFDEGRLVGPDLDLGLHGEAAERWSRGLYLRRGQVFLLGENLPESIDSRVYGPVTVDTVRGKVLLPPRWAKR
ncbi:MAG: signal peptidase I [Treponema sp.]|nr:signal peptidase I [Treponema sp.]